MLLVLFEVLRVSTVALLFQIPQPRRPRVHRWLTPAAPIARFTEDTWHGNFSARVAWSSSCSTHHVVEYTGKYTIERYVGYVLKGDKRGVCSFQQDIDNETVGINLNFCTTKMQRIQSTSPWRSGESYFKKLSQTSLPPCPLSPRNHGESLFRMYPNVLVQLQKVDPLMGTKFSFLATPSPGQAAKTKHSNAMERSERVTRIHKPRAILQQSKMRLQSLCRVFTVLRISNHSYYKIGYTQQDQDRPSSIIFVHLQSIHVS